MCIYPKTQVCGLAYILELSESLHSTWRPPACTDDPDGHVTAEKARMHEVLIHELQRNANAWGTEKPQIHAVQRYCMRYKKCSQTWGARRGKIKFFFFLSVSRFWICTKFLVVWFENLGVLVTWCGTETHAVQTRFECIRYREGSNANAWDIEKAQIHEVQRYCMGALHSPDERIPSGVAEEEFGRMISGKIFPWGLQSSVDAFGSCSWRWGVALECAMTCVC